MNRQELLAWTLRVYRDRETTADGRVLADALEEAGYPNAALLRRSLSKRRRRDFDDAIRWLSVGDQTPGSPVDRSEFEEWLTRAALAAPSWRDEPEVADAVFRDLRRTVPGAIRPPQPFAPSVPDFEDKETELPLWVIALLVPLVPCYLFVQFCERYGGPVERIFDWICRLGESQASNPHFLILNNPTVGPLLSDCAPIKPRLPLHATSQQHASAKRRQRAKSEPLTAASQPRQQNTR